MKSDIKIGDVVYLIGQKDGTSFSDVFKCIINNTTQMGINARVTANNENWGAMWKDCFDNEHDAWDNLIRNQMTTLKIKRLELEAAQREYEFYQKKKDESIVKEVMN